MAELRSAIRKHERTETTNNIARAAAEGGADYLRRWQNSDGSWAQGGMLNTNLALQALGQWESHTQAWTTNDGSQGGLEHAWHWLELQQNGAVWENIWNTAGVIQAAFYFKSLDRPSVQRAIAWLSDQKTTSWGLRDGLPIQHVSQAILAFDLLGIRAERDLATEQLLEALEQQPVLSEYSAGQALAALVTAGVSTESGPGARLVEQATITLMTDHVSISNFLDISSSFKGLGMARGGLSSEDPALQQTLGNFFSGARLRADGSWYADLTFTAYALIALTEVRATRRIEAYPADIYRPLEATRSKIIHIVSTEVHNSHLVALASGGASILGMILGGLLIVQVAGHVSLSASNNFGWFIAPILLGATVWCARYAWARIRHDVKGKGN